MDHTKRDAFGLGGKHPADGRSTVTHSYSDHTVAAGFDEELPGSITELGNIFNAEWNNHPAIRASTSLHFMG